MDSNYLLNFQTQNFKFKVFSGSDIELKMIRDFENDKDTLDYLSDFKLYLAETQKDVEDGVEPLRFTTIVYIDEIPIGILSLLNLGDNLVISHGIAPLYRGNGYSSKIKKEVFDYIFTNNNSIKEISAYVDKNNIKNIHSLSKLKNDGSEEIYDKKTGKTYFRISNVNPYYKENTTDRTL
jgi:RimJ/RimL family protein N-acetyltransferase